MTVLELKGLSASAENYVMSIASKWPECRALASQAQHISGRNITAGHHALHGRGVVAAFCMAQARRKLFEAHALNGSEIAAQAVALIAKLYEIEREARELGPTTSSSTMQGCGLPDPYEGCGHRLLRVPRGTHG